MAKRKVAFQSLVVGEAVPDPTLVRTHQQLIQVVVDLNEALTDATTIDQVEVILNEITEVNHRVSVLGRLLFKQSTAEITVAAESVTAAIADTKKAIEELESTIAVANALSAFLGLVDTVIDLAKLV